MNNVQSHAGTRLTSLDAMRGFTIAAMILVNYPGSWQHIYQPLEHAEWHGLTPTDLIFPFFLFIVGVSIALSYTKLLEKGNSRKELYKKIVFRALKIFAVGIILSLIPNFDFMNIRFAGVLQRISIVFLVCSFIFLNTSFKTQAWLGAVTLILYWLVMTLIPTPGVGYVSLEKGVNLAAWIDSMLLPGRMWQGTWDPEGILSTFPSIVTGITGLLAGHLLLSKRTPYDKSILLMILGFAAVTLGYVWGLTFPVNKNLWSSSFVLVTSGLASLLLGALYYIVDIRHYTTGTKPGIIFGANAIAIYVISDVISIIFYSLPFGAASLNVHFMTGLTAIGVAPKLVSMLYAIIFVCINFSIAYVLYKKKIFIRL
ncbi:heparan-alpha-glucosaminide N-acetyltransferase domain-containing protein [Chryseolinea sp. H1M3-3]|uniref:acyltransferase family protein n=1 Tax=Chryseolinea sp. H1M3-3 TaxID=3034144 RepID=UPI0023EB5F30|nr:heparan-alpha-glucosaminide N-acetyltransferase domain-containing protein [Chryseolinea sp. H1M3-3]